MPTYLNLLPGDIVGAISCTHAPISGANLVEVPEPRPEVIGQRYDRAASAAQGEPVFVPVEPAAGA